VPLNLRDLDLPGLTAALTGYGVDQAKTSRVFAAVQREGIASVEGMDWLSLPIRQALASDVVFPELEIVERRQAADGFVKYLFRLTDGALIEAVRIPLPDPDDARALREQRRRGEADGLVALPTAKHSVCISSQVGCSLGCAFCATGRLRPAGGVRNLAVWEMLAQVRAIAREAERPVRGILFLGMGEPLLNYDNVIRTARILSHPAGPAISADAISISTAGVAPAIRRFAGEGHRFRLIISLAAANSQARRALMPAEKTWPLDEVMVAVREYAASCGGRVSFAYVGISGVNMGRQQAAELAGLLTGLRAKVTLIGVNDETGRYQPPSEAEVNEFRTELMAHKIPVARRYAGGQDIGAACGTLAATQTGGALLAAPR
jgi:23S rRNA (adenine2503-C2)-methyltransferase